MAQPEKKKNRWKVEYGNETDRYKWTQTKEEVLITIPIPTGLKGRDITCEIKSQHLKMGLKGKPLIIDGAFFQKVNIDESTWIIEAGNVEITLTKGATSSKWWKSAIVGDPEIDVERLEGSQYVDDSLLRKLAERDEEEEKLKEKQESKTEEKPTETTQPTDTKATETTPTTEVKI